jgi:hypothetical protein
MSATAQWPCPNRSFQEPVACRVRQLWARCDVRSKGPGRERVNSVVAKQGSVLVLQVYLKLIITHERNAIDGKSTPLALSPDGESPSAFHVRRARSNRRPLPQNYPNPKNFPQSDAKTLSKRHIRIFCFLCISK